MATLEERLARFEQLLGEQQEAFRKRLEEGEQRMQALIIEVAAEKEQRALLVGQLEDEFG